MRLIDADKLSEAIHENVIAMYEESAAAKEDCLREIEEVPTVDAVPVVRCKDCVHWDDDPDTYGADDGPKGKCMKSFETMCADDFCSYGERKDVPDESEEV